jgi:hypothetical protein
MTRGQRVSSCPSFSPIGYDSPAAPRTATFLSARTELEKLLLARSEVCLATDRENIVCVLGLYARSRYELENDLGVVVSNTQMLSSVGRFGHSRRTELFQMWQWEQGGGRSRSCHQSAQHQAARRRVVAQRSRSHSVWASTARRIGSIKFRTRILPAIQQMWHYSLSLSPPSTWLHTFRQRYRDACQQRLCHLGTLSHRPQLSAI